LSFSTLYSENPDDTQLKLQVFNMVIELVDTGSQLWKSILAFPELYLTTQTILTKISKSKLLSSFPSPTKVTPLPFPSQTNSSPVYPPSSKLLPDE
jgi:hypothetical protein